MTAIRLRRSIAWQIGDCSLAIAPKDEALAQRRRHLWDWGLDLQVCYLRRFPHLHPPILCRAIWRLGAGQRLRCPDQHGVEPGPEQCGPALLPGAERA